MAVTTPAQLKAFSYERVSSGEQLQGGGLQRQSGMAAAWCEQHGYALDDQLRLSDAGLSAYRGDHVRRGALGRFLELARAGKLGQSPVLLIEAVDRISRQEPLDALQQVAFALIEAGVTIIDLEDGYTYNRASLSGDGLLLLVLKARSAHEYSKRLGRRLSAHWQQVREGYRQGTRTHRGGQGGKHPFWLELDADGRWQFNDKVVIVREAFALLLQQGLALTAQTLTGRGHRTSTGRPWSSDAVGRLAADPAAMGILRLGERARMDATKAHGRWKRERAAAEKAGLPFATPEPTVPGVELIPGFYPAAIDGEQWARVQRIITERRNSPKAKGNRGSGPGRCFLQGMVLCPAGSLMGVTRSKPPGGEARYYLRCRRRLDGRQCSCPGRGWLLHEVHEHVAVRLSRHLLQQAALPGDDRRQELASVGAQLAAAREQLEAAREAVRLAEAALESAIDGGSLEAVEAVTGSLERRRSALRSAEGRVGELSDERHRIEAASHPTAELQDGGLALLQAVHQSVETSAERGRLHGLLSRADLQVQLDENEGQRRVGMRFGNSAEWLWQKWEPGLHRMVADMGGTELQEDGRGGYSFVAAE